MNIGSLPRDGEVCIHTPSSHGDLACCHLPDTTSQNIKVDDYVNACLAGLNFGPSFCLHIGVAGLQSNFTTATQMDLEQLQRHDILIEHDAARAHQDAAFGPDYIAS